ncbi:MAG: 50S ribosomal protein L11 methyltransferase [Clostridia bacterium]|nr:50S ribosomal protein L11 methyltransferase [Clostridia bacterium]
MDWMEVTVLTTTAGADMISQILMDAGSSGTMIEDKNDVALNQRPEGQWDIIDEAIARRIGDDVKVTGYYEVDAGLADRVRMIEGEVRRIKGMDLGFDAGKLEVLSKTFAEEEWAETWKKAFKPFRLGSHMVIKPGWCECEIREGDKVIEIDPGMAFGTGTHETTGMCVELVEKYITPGVTAIDVGTGTGILAIAAAHMGAKDVLAIDIDRVAVRVAEENAKINGFGGLIRCKAGDLLENVDEQADVVIANIIADVIIMMAAPVRKHIKEGGRFICSGISSERKQDVLDELDRAGYTVLDVYERGGWCAIACDK